MLETSMMIDTHMIQLGLSFLSVIVFLVVNQVTTKIMAKLGHFKEVSQSRMTYIQSFF